MNHRRIASLLVATLLPLLLLAFVTQSLAESAEQQAIPSLEAETVAVTTAYKNELVGANGQEAELDVDDTGSTSILADTDLGISKEDSHDPVIAGQNLTYTLTITNTAAAQNVVVTDTLPAGVQFVSATSSKGGSCDEGQSITCTLGTVGANSTETIIIVVKVDPDQTGTLRNTAGVRSDATDINPDNNHAIKDTTVISNADLGISKADDPALMTAGKNLTYTLTVSNTGPSDASNVVVTDTLPAGVQLISVTPSKNGPCDEGQSITCTLGTLSPTVSETVTIVVQVSSEQTGTLRNSAGVRSDTTDSNPDNDDASEDTTVISDADLGISKAGDPAWVTASKNLTYTLTVSNTGPSVAQNVMVTDTLPNGVTPLTTTTSLGTTCNETANPVTCELGTMAVLDSVTITMVVRVGTAVTGTINNQAQVGSDATDSNGDNNNAAEDTTVISIVDLGITKVGTPISVTAGKNLTYTLTVSNTGPSAAGNVVVTDTLPNGVVPLTTTTSLGTTCNVTADPVTCNLGTMAVLDSVTITMVVRVGTAVTDTIKNQVQVGSDAIDSNGGNDSASADTTVVTAADLGIIKTDDPAVVTAGKNLTYTLTVSNTGPSDAANVVVTDTLPAGVKLISVTPSKNEPCDEGQSITCTLGTLSPNISETITIVVQVSSEQTGTLRNSAGVRSDTTDSNPTNDHAAEDTTVILDADLGISKADNPTVVTAGKNLTYTLTVSNTGPSVAQNVMVTDTLPNGVTPLTTTTSLGTTCNKTANPVTCDLGTMAVLDSVTITMVIRVGAGVTGTINNQALVGSNTTDSNEDNNNTAEDTTVISIVDLSITKAGDPTVVTAGKNLIYTLTVSNTGPSVAQNVMVTDTLPNGVTPLTTTTSLGTTCNETVNLVTCDVGTMAVLDSVTITMVVRVGAGVTGTIKNQAQVGSDPTDSNGDNNNAFVDTTVVSIVDLGITKTDDPAVVTAGKKLTYTLTVSNTGPSAAGNVVVTDTLANGVTLLSTITSLGTTCNETANPVTCDLGTMAVLDSVTITMVVRVGAGVTGTINNQAQVGSDATDSNGDNDDAFEETIVIALADIGISKDGKPNPVMAGQNLTYTLIVSNTGPSDATGVLVTDTLPIEAQYVTATTSKGNSCIGTNPVLCDLETLTVGQSAWITIVVSLGASLAPTIINNTAVASSDAPDPNPTNNTFTETTTVEPVADLKIIKSAAPDPVTAGDQLTYMLTITNAGPSNATGVVVTDTLPSETITKSVFSSQGSPCDEGSTVVCVLGDLPVGASAKITIAVTVDSAVVGIIENKAEVAGEQTDSNEEDNLAMLITSVNQEGALPLVKLDDPDPVLAGTNLTYTLHISSTGPSDATSVTLTDTLPSEVNFITMTTNLGTCNHLTGTVMCDLGDMPVGTEATVEILVKVDSTVLGQINNSAIVGADGVAPSLVNQNSTVNGSADLKVGNVAWPDPVTAGQGLTFTIAVTNIGPSLAEQVVVNNPLPMGVTFNSSPDCILVVATVTCDFGDLGAGETISTTILVDVDPAADGIISSAALVFGDTPDPNPANNSSIATANTVAESDLGIGKSGSTKEVVAGANLTYTLTISNSGPSDALGVEVRDTVPAGVTLLSTVTSKGSCNEGANPVVCDLETLEASTSATITIKVLVDPATLGTIQNQAEVSSDTPDGNPANDDAIENTTVIAVADLFISKIGEPEPVTAGEYLTYTLTITNIGPSVATNVMVTDTLPLGVDLIPAIPSQDGPCVGERTITCTLGTLNVNGNATIHVSVAVSSTQIAPLLNTADVRSSAADLNLSNNHAEEQTAVVRSADLSIDVDSRPNPVVAGELLTYTLTINNVGPSDASGVVVTNTLPAEVQLTDVTATVGGDCNGNPIVICDFDNLSVDSSAMVTLTVTVDPTIAATVYNTATVSSKVTDPLLANNSKVEQTTVVEKLYVTHLPIIYAGPGTDEPNDTCEQAHRIIPNTNYRFFPEDQFDWYHFDTAVDGTMTAILSDFKPLFGQIALYKGNNCSNRVLLGNNGNTSMNKSVHADFQTAGHFYVFVSNDGVLTDEYPYSLIVTVTE